MTRRCAWCPRTSPARRVRPSPASASHGICRPCLAAGLRGDRTGYARSGAHFTVWDSDARAGAAWGEELAALEAALAPRARRAAAQG